MPLHQEGPPSPNKRNPNSQQNISSASMYSFVPDTNTPYGTFPSREKLCEYTGDNDSAESFFQRHPESSQRTPMQEDLYGTQYDSGAESRYVGTISDSTGTSTVHQNFVGTHIQATPTSRIPHAPQWRSVTSPGVHAFSVEPLGGPSPGSPRNITKYVLAGKTLYSHTESRSHLEALSFPSSMEPQRSRPLTPFQIKDRSTNQFDTPSIVHADDTSQYAPYTHPAMQTSQPRTTISTLSTSSIPMSNSPGVWSSTPLGSAFNTLSPPQHPLRKLQKRSSSRMTPDSDTLSSIGHPIPYVDNSIPDILSSSSVTSPPDPLVKKKKSKMHECEVCGKHFPRPSGLQTHMNTHNNVKPFPCGFPGCSRSFAVRSNATRHLRTHGALPSHPSPPAPYTVNFSAPTVMTSSTPPSHELENAPYKLRWMPPSLMTRTNVESLTSVSDAEYDSDDVMEVSENIDWRSALSIPLPPVIPSSYTNDINTLEERNSYLDAKPYPYHPSQFTVLPGPAVRHPTSVGRGAV